MAANCVSRFDPMRLVAWHRRALFLFGAGCGPGLRVTERANLFVHDAGREQIRLRPNALIDGTVEVYRSGRLTVGRSFFLGRSRLYCAHSVTIGDYVLVSDQVTIMDSNLHPTRASRRRVIADAWSQGRFPDVYLDVPGSPVVIGDDVWIGYGAAILKGVTLGQGVIVGAGAVVTSDVPPWTVVAGNPARVIRELDPDER